MEIGESLVGSYLKHIVGCDVVLFNTHLVEVQGELDVIGIKTLPNGEQKIWLVEVTTHLLGMLYKTQSETVKKVLEKKNRAELFARKLFSGAQVAFEVWSPIVPSGIVSALEAERVTLVANHEYTKRINLLAEHASKSTQTTGDDAYRLLQLLTHLRGARPKFAFAVDSTDSKPNDNFTSVPTDSASSEEVLKFAYSYDGYSRMIADLNVLQSVYSDTIENFNRSKALDGNLGLDYLRGLLFVLARTDHFVDGFWETHFDLARAVVAGIRLQAGSKVPILR